MQNIHIQDTTQFDTRTILGRFVCMFHEKLFTFITRWYRRKVVCSIAILSHYPLFTQYYTMHHPLMHQFLFTQYYTMHNPSMHQFQFPQYCTMHNPSMHQHTILHNSPSLNAPVPLQCNTAPQHCFRTPQCSTTLPWQVDQPVRTS